MSKQLSKNRNKPIIVSFDGFYYQIFMSQGMLPLRSYLSFPFEINPLSVAVFSLFLLLESSSEISELIAS